MKRYICLLLAFTIALSLWGCNKDAATATVSTDTSPTTIPTTAPTGPSDPTEATTCDHSFDVYTTITATCTKPGSVTSICSVCGKRVVEEIPVVDHKYASATCTAPKTCRVCDFTDGAPTGHHYTDGVCTRCSTVCTHEFLLVEKIPATCSEAGLMRFQCRTCDHGYEQKLSILPHSYVEATCTEPKICSNCALIFSKPLGHVYSDGICTVCGEVDTNAPKEVTYTVTIRSDKGVAVEGVTVTVFTDGDIPAATGRTNTKGVATMTLMGAESYRVVLSNVPAGLAAKESYTFKSTRANINLTTVSVISPTDHSQANYKIGSTMGDFTQTDTDGNTYNLYQLLKEKDLVILNFWFVNCGPCKAEFPYFEAINEKYDNVQLLTMNHLDSEKDILALREQMGVTFPMISENIGFQQGFGITAYPTTVFIAPNGKILKIKEGDFRNQAELETLIESLLK